MIEKLKKTISVSLRFFIAALIIFFLTKGKKKLIIQTINSISPVWFAAALLLFAVSFLVCVARWHSLLKIQKINLSFVDTLILSMQGLFFSLVIPGAVGGDLVKAGFIAAKAGEGMKTKAIFSILIDRIIGLLGLFLLAAFLGILCFKQIAEFANSAKIIIFVLIAGIILGIIGAGIIFFHRTLERIYFIKQIIALADKYTRGFPSLLMEALDGYKKSSVKIILWIIVSAVFVHSAQGLALFCLISGTSDNFQKVHYVLLTSSLANAVGALPLTPSGLGTRDMEITSLLRLSGMNQEKSISIAIMNTGLIIIFNLIAGISLLHIGGKKNREVKTQ